MNKKVTAENRKIETSATPPTLHKFKESLNA